jgi:hypothetical protein
MNTSKYLSKLTFIAGATLIMATSIGCSKEEGCTDPAADNYDANAEKNCCCIYSTSGSNRITTDVTWSSDVIHELNGRVIVENGATLTIEPGTIIKGATGTGTLASALIITRGSKIIADGTADEPIIFTSVLDNIEIGQKTGSNLTENDTQKWGGLIILGNAPISAEEGDDVAQIEGLPADEGYGAYGGTNIADDSGILRYVSVRHGGALIGEGNEINGITFGGVGTGTIVDHVEVVANEDDGVEFFGGSVNATNVIIAFQKDDGIDIDQNYSGTIDNFFVLHGVSTDEGLEIDGPEGTLSNGLFTLRNGTVRNTTPGIGSAADLKSKAQGTLENITFWGYDGGAWLKMRASFQNDCADPRADTYSYYTDASPSFVITGCEFGNPSTDDVLRIYTGSSYDAPDSNGDPISCPVPASYETVSGDIFSAANPLVEASTPTIGADLTEFDTWSWSSVNNKY